MHLVVKFGLFLSSLVIKGSCDDTVADDIGSHMMGRIAEQLTPEECQDFYTRLITPEKDVQEELDKLSEENNPIKRRRKREIELSKNLNQDKNLELRRFVDGFPKSIKQSSSLLDPEEEKYGETNRRSREVKDIAWEDWELIIEREKLPPYDRGLFEWAKPLAFGFIFGFLGSTVLAAAVLHITVLLTNWDWEDLENSVEALTLQNTLENPGDPSSDDTDTLPGTFDTEVSLNAVEIDFWRPHSEL